MTPKSFRMMTVSNALMQLYGYIYCMLLSNTLAGMPLFGGALYLCGRTVMVFSSLYGKKSRQYLPGYARKWGLVLLIALPLITYLVFAIYPGRLDEPDVWIIFAMTVLCLTADGMSARIFRLTGFRKEASAVHIGKVSLVWQMVLVIASALILVINLGGERGWPLTGGFAALILIRAYTVWQITERNDVRAEKNEDSARRRLTSLYNEFVEHRLFDRNTEESIYNAIKQKAEDENIQGTEQSIPCVIFSFANLSSVITACSISAPDYTDESSLYKMDDKYFLVLRCAYKNLHPSVRNCFTEYGESCPVQNGRLGMLTEYGKVLVETGAVQAMAECN